MYDLHSGRVSQHFSDRELCIGCTKLKVGIELHDIVQNFHIDCRDPSISTKMGLTLEFLVVRVQVITCLVTCIYDKKWGAGADSDGAMSDHPPWKARRTSSSTFPLSHF
jgi:hypothetical protein